MITQANLDTGIITLHYSHNEPIGIKKLMQKIQSHEITACIVSPAMIECFYQLTKFPGGIDFAEKCIIELYKNYSITIVELNQSLVIKAGIIKSQHRNILSLVDASIIAFSLNNKIKLHTTEKNLKNLFPKLQLEIYSF